MTAHDMLDEMVMWMTWNPYELFLLVLGLLIAGLVLACWLEHR